LSTNAVRTAKVAKALEHDGRRYESMVRNF